MTTVFVWESNIVSYRVARAFGLAPASHRVEGHVSVNIDDHFVPVVDIRSDQQDFFDNKKSYVSWVPSFIKQHHKKELSHGEKFMGVGNRNFFADLFLEGYAPDHIIRIPNPPPDALERMRQEWKTHKELKDGRPQSYDFETKNCARVVSRVLRAGWGEHRNIQYGQLARGIWTPNMVQRMALDLRGGENKPAFTMSWLDFLCELWEKDAIRPQTVQLLSVFQKRSDEHGTTEARSRFEIETTRRGLREERKIIKKEDNVLPEVILYTELKERGETPEHARDILTDWLGRRPENSLYQDNIDEMRRMADELIRYAYEGGGKTTDIMVQRSDLLDRWRRGRGPDTGRH